MGWAGTTETTQPLQQSPVTTQRGGGTGSGGTWWHRRLPGQKGARLLEVAGKWSGVSHKLGMMRAGWDTGVQAHY